MPLVSATLRPSHCTSLNKICVSRRFTAIRSRALAVVELNEQNFEHLTQAATGATSGDWLVLFCKESVPRCQKVQQNWQRVAVTLAASREAKGLPRINVAEVDTSQSSWLRKRFGIQSVPVVLLFKGGVMYSFHGGGAHARRPRARAHTHAAVSASPRPPTRASRRACRFLRREARHLCGAGL